MTSNTAPPFLVFDGPDLFIFETLDLIEQGLEGIDVENGTYEAFDSIGRVILLKTSGVIRGKFSVDIGETHAEIIESVPTGTEQLRGLICGHLKSIGHNAPRNLDLSDLVAECISRNANARPQV